MRIRPLALVSFLLCAVPASAVELDDLKPNLVAVYTDGARGRITRLEPTVAVAWKKDEAAHPRLAADGGTATWTGYVNLLRAGNYRFAAKLRGKVTVTVAGKEVLTAEVKDEAPAQKEGMEVRLDAGVQPITVTFTRLPGPARLELLWQGPGFRREPLPYSFLFHDPKKLPPELANDALVERGRLLAEEHGCVSCHRPEANDRLGQGLIARKGSDLSQVGGRVYDSWLYHWLLDPEKVRPGAVMPRMFGDDDNGRVEAYAVSRYLVSLGGPFKDEGRPQFDDKKLKDWLNTVTQGHKVYASLGCAACHPAKDDEPKTRPEAKGPTTITPLGRLGSKTDEKKLSAYLQNPLALDPSGRMPRMVLGGNDANMLARYLCWSRDKDIPTSVSPPGNKELTEAQWVEMGKKLVVEKNCVACHTIAPDKKPVEGRAATATLTAIKSEKTHTRGCLAEAGKRGTAPAYALSGEERKALRAFLVGGATGAGSPASAYTARVTLERFNCLACHSRNGEGGLTLELAEELRKFEKAENAEAISPPPLTGVGHKLRTSWLRSVLVQEGRARPWMALHMPQFGEANVGHLPDALAALDGTEPDDTVHKVALTPEKLEAGRALVGKAAFGCISCHDLADIPNTGTRGPDMAYMNQRVRYDWYLRWLTDAQRIQPGTRMPTVFPEGKTLIDQVLAGNADAQAEAMWAYLSLGKGLQLPDGMEPAIKGRILAVKDRPVILRTFMPDAGSRAMAVGFPGGVSVAFDAATCRLSYVWQGGFLDVSPVWDGRGGNPAKLLGNKVWTSPAGCPWGLGESDDPPDFAVRAQDPAYGGPLAEDRTFQGIKQLHFIGYVVDEKGVPTFRYRVGADDAKALEVSETAEPLQKAGVAVGVRRSFTAKVPEAGTPWLFVGETKGEPRLLDGKSDPLALDLKPGRVDVPTAGRKLVLPQGGDRVTVFEAKQVPSGTTWLLLKQGDTWRAFLRLPPKAGDVKVSVDVWSPFRDEPALLKGLATK